MTTLVSVMTNLVSIMTTLVSILQWFVLDMHIDAFLASERFDPGS